MSSEDSNTTDASTDFDEEDVISELSDIDDEHELHSRKRTAANEGFFLDEAEVGTDSEDEELYNESGFSYGDKNHQPDYLTNFKKSKHRTNFERLIQSQENLETDQLVQRWTQKGDSGAEFENLQAPPKSHIFRQQLLPTANDPNLWLVRCRIGEETNAVLALMRKYVYMKKKNEPLQIMSATTVPGVKGYVYVEAFKQNHVKQAISRMSFFNFSGGRQQMVPINEMPDVFGFLKETVNIEPKSLVRIKRGLYKGDLGQVDSVDLTKNIAIVKLVPRINYSCPTPKTQQEFKQMMFFRPKPELFNAEKLKNNGFDVETESGGLFRFNKARFINGLLFKRFPIKALQVENIEPLLHELESLNVLKEGENTMLTFNRSNDANSGTDLTSNNSIPANTDNQFKINDNVKVVTGELKDLTGKIISSNNDGTLLVKLEHQDINENLEFLPNDLKKCFKIGDGISVFKGSHSGESGFVVKIEDEYVTFFNKDSQKEFRVFANNVKMMNYSDLSKAALTLTNNLNIGSLVQIDQNIVAVILSINNVSAKVLNSHNKIIDVNVSKLVPYNKRTGLFFDSKKNPIIAGDIVRVIKAGDFVNVIGEIRHFYRGIVFIFSKSFPSESGNLIATSFRNIELNKNSAAPDDANLDFDIESSIGNNKNKQTSSKVRSRASNPKLIGASLSITRGPYKGYIGTIKGFSQKANEKSGNTEFFRVELYSNSKIINICINDIKLTGENADYNLFGNTVPRSRPTGTPSTIHTPFGSEIGRTPGFEFRMGNRTPVYNDPSKTPGYQDLTKTPGHYDMTKTPGHYDMTKTPAYNENTSNEQNELGNRYNNKGFGNTPNSYYSQNYRNRTPNYQSKNDRINKNSRHELGTLTDLISNSFANTPTNETPTFYGSNSQNKSQNIQQLSNIPSGSNYSNDYSSSNYLPIQEQFDDDWGEPSFPNNMLNEFNSTDYNSVPNDNNSNMNNDSIINSNANQIESTGNQNDEDWGFDSLPTEWPNQSNVNNFDDDWGAPSSYQTNVTSENLHTHEYLPENILVEIASNSQYHNHLGKIIKSEGNKYIVLLNNNQLTFNIFDLKPVQPNVGDYVKLIDSQQNNDDLAQLVKLDNNSNLATIQFLNRSYNSVIQTPLSKLAKSS